MSTSQTLHWWHYQFRTVNTVSNVAYPLAGWVLAAILHFPPEAVAFAASMTVLGIGSALYHWFGPDRLRWADWFGMFVVFAGLVAVGFNGSATDAAFFALAGGAVGIGIFGLVGADAALGAGLVLASIPAILAGPLPASLAAVSFFLFLIAKVFHNEDNHAAAPGKSWVGVWGHGMWHAWTALAFAALFLALYVRGVA